MRNDKLHQVIRSHIYLMKSQINNFHRLQSYHQAKVHIGHHHLHHQLTNQLHRHEELRILMHKSLEMLVICYDRLFFWKHIHYIFIV